MKASDIFDAIRRKYAQNALVPEVTISDFDWLENLDVHAKPTRRIDALMFDSFERTAIEIKVSRTDFKREHSGKYMPWVRVTHRFIYAVPEGLIEPSEVWDLGGNYQAGLWYVHEDGTLTVARKAKSNKHPEPLPQQVVQALAYRATPKLAPAPEQQAIDLGSIA